MYKAKEQFYLKVYQVVDVAICAVAFVLAVEIRSRLTFEPLVPFHGTLRDYGWQLAALLGTWWVLLHSNRLYASHRGRSASDLVWGVVKANVQGLFLVGTVLFFSKEYWIHRTLILLYVLLCILLLSVEKLLLFRALAAVRKFDKNIKHVLIIGTGKRARKLLESIGAHPDLGLRVLGVLGDRREAVGTRLEGAPVIGVSTDLPQVLHEAVVDEVFIALSMKRMDEIRNMLVACEEVGINGRILAQLYNPVKASVYVDELLGQPFITFTTQPTKVQQLFLKNVLDMTLAIVQVALLSPAFLLAALLIKLDSRGPVFFRQERAGLNGRKFTMYKFRSMTEGAHQQRFALESQNEMDGPVFKMRNDPRITRLGKILRRTSFDEFPQLINVLKGEMSLVGPRPLPLYEAEQITGLRRRRLSMKPGITGLWQISGRSDADFDTMMKLDLSYIDEWSLLLDLRILFRTLFAWYRGTGAY